jgi:uncharacterized protein YjbI with pentapeptide repeats
MISDLGIWAIVINLIALAFAVQYSRSKSFGEALVWLVWDFTGFRFVASKVFPTQKGNASPPVTITLWVLGIYTALFGIASNRYENAVDKIENRMNAFITQLSIAPPEIRKEAFREVAEIQWMVCPIEPDLLRPSSVVLSLIRQDIYKEAVTLLIRTVEKYRNDLEGAKLFHANLKEAILKSCNLMDADLRWVNFYNADLNGANLQNADLAGSNLELAKLKRANLNSSNLVGADFKVANLRYASFKDAIFSDYPIEFAFYDGQNRDISGKINGNNFDEIQQKLDALVKKLTPNSRHIQMMSMFRPTDLHGSDCFGADFKGAKGLYVEQLCSTRTLFKSSMDPEIEAQVRSKCPEKFRDPHDSDETPKWDPIY